MVVKRGLPSHASGSVEGSSLSEQREEGLAERRLKASGGELSVLAFSLPLPAHVPAQRRPPIWSRKAFYHPRIEFGLVEFFLWSVLQYWVRRCTGL